MQRYREYKDSGVKWLGEIPSHWEVKRLASFFTERRVKVSDKEYEPLSVTKQGIFPQLDNVAKTNDGDNRKLVKEGDFVINSRSDRKGSSGVADRDGSVSLINIVLKPRKTILAKYSNYLLKSYKFIEEYYRNGRGIVADLWTTRFDEMKMIKLVIPTLDEQEAIATYLDEATLKIDAAIAQQQRMIELLNERKQIIINAAVTKGLDPNVKMKDSGVEWIGEIPEHWEVKRGKYIFKIINELSETGEEDLLSVSDKTGVTPRSMKNVTMFMSESLVGYKRCFIGDICSNIMWMWHGAIGVTKYEGVISPSYGVYRQIKKVFTDNFLDMLLRLPRLVKLYSVLSTGLTESRLRLYPTDFLNICFFIPPIDEQQRIQDYIYLRCKPLDKEIKRLNDLIILLQERKQIIINDVVTGKVKVI
jgi:type I restriction enzyme S subunit